MATWFKRPIIPDLLCRSYPLTRPRLCAVGTLSPHGGARRRCMPPPLSRHWRERAARAKPERVRVTDGLSYPHQMHVRERLLAALGVNIAAHREPRRLLHRRVVGPLARIERLDGRPHGRRRAAQGRAVPL